MKRTLYFGRGFCGVFFLDEHGELVGYIHDSSNLFRPEWLKTISRFVGPVFEDLGTLPEEDDDTCMGIHNPYASQILRKFFEANK